MTPAAGEFDTLGCPLAGINLIEASAGTGKTFNVCALYLRLLLERELDVTDILVVTFTKAATAELRERIRSRIADALLLLGDGTGAATPADGDPFVVELLAESERRGLARDAMRKRLESALQNFDQAAIFTIHSFCQRALADTPLASGVPFDYELVTDDSDLAEEVANDFWRRHVAGEELAPALAGYLLANKDSPGRWSKLLARQLAKPLARTVWPEEPLPAALDAQATARAWQVARSAWHAGAADVVALLKAATALNKGSYKPHLIDRTAGDWERFFAIGDPLAPIDPDWELDRFRRSILEDRTNKKQTPPLHPFFDAAEDYLEARAELDGALSRARRGLLRRLCAEGATDIRQRKRERRIAGYNDLLWNLHAALTGDDGPRLAAALRRRYQAALIDEFQDTDPLQFGIFDAIYGDGAQPVFLVGDPKQAIYSFRHADVHAYLRARAKAGARYTLTRNQRATPELIKALNAVFGANARAFVLADLDYLPAQPGIRPREVLLDSTAPHADFQLWHLPRPQGTPLARTPALEAAGAATAAEIARLLTASDGGSLTLDGNRLRAEHIAVLVRSHREGRRVRESLAALGVGSIELAQVSVFETPDAEDFQRVLTAILEPAHGGLLRAALATEVLGRDALAIEAMSADERGLAQFATRFAGYRDEWIDRGFGAMFRHFLAEERVAARLLARADGERRLTNLLHLGELAQAAAAEHASPDALLRWLEARCRDKSQDDNLLLRLESDRNLVRIVTIHKAKGLEFEFVFCPFLWDGHVRRSRDQAEAREYHDSDGAAIIDFRADGEIEEYAGSAARLDIDRRIRLEAAAESLRLIYVALTRARQRCYLVAGCYVMTGKPGAVGQSVRGLLNWLAAGAGVAPEDWLHKSNKRTCDDTDAAWARVVAAADGAIRAEPLPATRGTPLALEAGLNDALFAAAPPPRIVETWRIGSFSSLVLGAANEASASDHDARLAAPPSGVGPPPAEVAPDDILRFPRGRSAGDCLHAVFEQIDFTDASTFDPAIAAALRKHPQPFAAASAPRAPGMIAQLLRDVLATPLPGGFKLESVARANRLTELEFHVPAPHLDAVRLDAALATLGYAAPRLNPRPLDGYLKGFVDLVFEHAGRYYVLDWKSNHLGYTREDYGPAAVARAMAQHGYHLQYLLYSIALQRFLRHRLPDFDPERHVGGVLYLFLRGVRPGWRNPDGTPSGVYFAHLPIATLATLEALLGEASMGAS